MGLQDFGVGRSAGAFDVGGISGAAADGGNLRFSLCDAMEPTGQSLEGRAVHGGDEAGEEEARSRVCAGAGRRRLHGECTAGGFAAARCAVYVRTRWRAAAGGARRAVAADRAASLCVEEREVGAGVHVAGSGPAGILGAQWVSRVRRSMERAEIFWEIATQGRKKAGGERSAG